jgi:hypothetical protein
MNALGEDDQIRSTPDCSCFQNLTTAEPSLPYFSPVRIDGLEPLKTGRQQILIRSLTRPMQKEFKISL